MCGTGTGAGILGSAERVKTKWHLMTHSKRTGNRQTGPAMPAPGSPTDGHGDCTGRGTDERKCSDGLEGGGGGTHPITASGESVGCPPVLHFLAISPIPCPGHSIHTQSSAKCHFNLEPNSPFHVRLQANFNLAASPRSLRSPYCDVHSHSNLPSAIVSFRLWTIRFGRPTDGSRFHFLGVSVLSLFSGF